MDSTIEVVVTGEQRMNRVSCETRIAYALRQLHGVHDLRASAQTQHVQVLFGGADASGRSAIADKPQELGYEAQRVGGAA